MESADLAQWLLRNAGPSIRFHTLVDILNEQDVGLVARSLDEMINSPEVKKWMGLLTPKFDINSIHSGRYDAYENVMGKLVQLGQRAGLQPFDNMTLPFRVWLSECVEKPPERPHSIFLRTIVASFLAYAGYGSTTPVEKQMVQRLDSLYSFAKNPDFSQIFADEPKFKGAPKKSDHRMVNPELYPEQKFVFPWVHDMRGLAHCPDIINSEKYGSYVEKIVDMVLTPEYQKLPWSYGLARYEDRYYVIGWAVHLPGYWSEPEEHELSELLLTLAFMARFRGARDSVWFKDSMEFLETFRTDTGTYLFPRKFLPERKFGYWVGGTRMMFDERKGHANAIECESTFHILQIKKMMNKK